MKISARGRYALSMMLDLAEHAGDGFVPLRDIAERQGISKKYLEQIVPLFQGSGMLKTTRGFQGGYMLARPPDRYSVGEVLRVTEGDFFPVPAVPGAGGPDQTSGEYAMLPVWEELARRVAGYLDSVSLQDVLDMRRERYADDYVI